eukprot:352735-Chlamydomonas_euryale.AAC.9
MQAMLCTGKVCARSMPTRCMDAGVYDKYMTCMWWACVAQASVFMLVLVRVACLCMVGLGHDSGGMCDYVVLMIACSCGKADVALPTSEVVGGQMMHVLHVVAT